MSLAVIAAILIATPLAAQESRADSGNTFVWNGRIPAGSWLRVRNVNGAVIVAAATGDVAQVRGEKTARRGDEPRAVRVLIEQEGGDVTLCAVWHDGDRCDDRDHRSRGDREDNDDVSVRFIVALPRGVKVAASSVNGAVEVRGATAEVSARTVNGDVAVATAAGPANASSVNGALDVRMDAVPAGGDELKFSTVNGSITLHLPARLDVDFEMTTVNGSLNTDYPMTVTGRINPRKVHATIGGGGRKLTAKTVNGSVSLRKAG